MDVNISDPLTSTNVSMRKKVNDLTYHIVYWERFAETEVGSGPWGRWAQGVFKENI